MDLLTRNSHAKRYSCRIVGPWERSQQMDIVYLLILAALYASTHWVVRAISRLGGDE